MFLTCRLTAEDFVQNLNQDRATSHTYKDLIHRAKLFFLLSNVAMQNQCFSLNIANPLTWCVSLSLFKKMKFKQMRANKANQWLRTCCHGNVTARQLHLQKSANSLPLSFICVESKMLSHYLVIVWELMLRRNTPKIGGSFSWGYFVTHTVNLEKIITD